MREHNDLFLIEPSMDELKIKSKIYYLGFQVNEWFTDIKTRLDKIQISEKKKNLSKLESRLNLLISKEMRDNIELEKIKKELGL